MVKRRIPGRLAIGEPAYIVDFLHDWDIHNRRPGYLYRNDIARMTQYEQYGFAQYKFKRVEELPFLGGLNKKDC